MVVMLILGAISIVAVYHLYLDAPVARPTLGHIWYTGTSRGMACSREDVTPHWSQHDPR